MGTTQLAILNSALEFIKSQDLTLAGSYPNFTGSSAIANAANVLYGPVRDLLLREVNPEFGRITIVAAGSGATPIAPWSYEYLYPQDGLRIRQIRPPTSGPGALADPNDPVPVRGSVAFEPRAAGGAKVVLTNQQNALLVYTSNTPPEAFWDPDFAWALSRTLAEPFAMAIAGRPDWARELLDRAQQYGSLSMENTDL